MAFRSHRVLRASAVYAVAAGLARCINPSIPKNSLRAPQPILHNSFALGSVTITASCRHQQEERQPQMMTLEQLQTNAALRGIVPDGLVTVVNVQWFGSEAVEHTYKTPDGQGANELCSRHDEPRL